MRYTAVALFVAGYVLAAWAHYNLPAGTPMWPLQIQWSRCTFNGPYRWLRHPMYVGILLSVCAAAYLAAGWWNVVAIGTTTELLLREWAHREDGGPGLR